MSVSLPPDREPTNGELLAAINGLASTLVSMHQRLNRLEAPPTKSELIEQVRERDAEIELLREQLSELKAGHEPG